MSMMMHEDGVSYKKKNCARCGKLLPRSYKKDYCEGCQEALLFDEVRDFIRNNNVTEREVAEYFDLPREKVRAWLRDGRIEYTRGGNRSLDQI